MKKKNNFKKILGLLLFLVMVLTCLPTNLAKAAATGAPGSNTIQSDQWGEDVDGDYNLTVNMWYGNNGTSYKLYEKLGAAGEYKVVAEGTLTDNTPSAQNFVISITGREKGTYYYYVELTNSYGSTNGAETSVKVGGGETSNIFIKGVDDDEVQCQFTIPQGTSTFDISNLKSETSTFSLYASNTSVVKASISGNTLTVNGLQAGRSGLKIIDDKTGDIRYIGVRVKESDGTLPGLPNYVALGQVSEDIKGDLEFWQDLDVDDTNKRCDIRYVYVNGGPIGGWRSWTTEDGGRVKKYITESLKLGLIPYFVFYNIPDSAEDYNRDLQHVNDTSYMEAYYKDLKFFLDIINDYAKDELVGIILEPDFIGYMMQLADATPTQIEAKGVEAAYTSGVLTKGTDPEFTNNITGICESINYIINKTCSQVTFGWQFNTWGYHEVGTPARGLMHVTEEMIKGAAIATADYYMEAGILSYGADFISIDKYGYDGAYDGKYNNPVESNWFWNADLWNNYLYYTKCLHERTGMPVTLWQMPVGHINQSQEPDPYDGGLFNNLTNTSKNYEDSAPTYFFGDTFKPGSGNRFDYFSSNVSNDPKITSNGDTVTYGSHIKEAMEAGVTAILFGAGVGDSTDAVGNPPGEDYWWITKAQRYYKDPVYLENKTVVVTDKEDVDGNGKVDLNDLSKVALAYGTKTGNAKYNAKYDINSDGVIDIVDLVLVAKKIN